MTYNKYTHFLIYQEGEEYDAAYTAGTESPFSGIQYCESAAAKLSRSVRSRCRHRGITRTRRPKARSDGGSV
ncbi:MAG: hypothetical protein WAM77_03650 [Xanthobacteraceae bacterium]